MAKVHTRLKELHKKNAGAGRHSSKPASDNPFEAKFTRQKHLVLNRKVKGSRGRPGLTRKKSEEAVRKHQSSFFFLMTAC